MEEMGQEVGGRRGRGGGSGAREWMRGTVRKRCKKGMDGGGAGVRQWRREGLGEEWKK